MAFNGLQQNLAANPELTNIRILQQCVAARTGEVKFGSRSGGGDTMSSMLFAEGRTAWTVPAIRLDEFAAQEKLESPIFLKIDTEGGEYAILPTLHRFFRRYRTTPDTCAFQHRPILTFVKYIFPLAGRAGEGVWCGGRAGT